MFVDALCIVATWVDFVITFCFILSFLRFMSVSEVNFVGAAPFSTAVRTTHRRFNLDMGTYIQNGILTRYFEPLILQ